jgi:hypothetical protein
MKIQSGLADIRTESGLADKKIQSGITKISICT